MTNQFRSTNLSFSTLFKLPLGWMRKLALLGSLVFFGYFMLTNPAALAQTDKRQAGVIELAGQSKPTNGKRVALLLANSKYVTSPLSNPKNDLALMEKTLRSLGFEVVGGVSKGQDLKAAEMAQLLRGEFRSALRNADTAVVFYAGHGEAFDGETYLLDVNYAFIGKESVDYQSLALTNIYKEIENANVPHNFVFIDACRTLPGPVQNRGNNQRNIGLAQPKDPPNTITLFSTGLGSAANDGVGSANSPFTAVLASELAKPGQDWDDIEKAISREVKKSTRSEQQPKRYGGLDVKYFFHIQAPTTIVVQPAPTATSTASSVELAFWSSAERLNTLTAYQNYLNKYPKGEFAPLAQTAIEGLRAAQAAASAGAATQRPAVAALVVAAPVAAPQPAPIIVAAPPVSKAPQPGQTFKDCADCPEMVVIPTGSFMMGSPVNEKDRGSDEGPQRNISIKSFAMGKTEVTQGQYKAIMGENPSHNKSCGDDCPVDNVTWLNTQSYVKYLSLKTGKAYRLPSEAEWEYAARADTTTPFYTGMFINSDQANFNDSFPQNGSVKGIYREKTIKSASFIANTFGLHEMHGNVWEWVQDCYFDKYIVHPLDGTSFQTSESCEKRVLRGGSFMDSSQKLRTSSRFSALPNTSYRHMGFRLARTLP